MFSPLVSSLLILLLFRKFYICKPFFIFQLFINKTMGNAHYNKYKETIKKVARRNYRKRVKWLNDFLADKYCVHCKESETVCLKFYPHDLAIRRKVKRVGINEESQVEIKELINSSKIVCRNCWVKLDNDLIEFDTF